MKIHLLIRNSSQRKRFHRRDVLQWLADRVCTGEGVQDEVELSLLFCDDAFITDLNRTYRHKDAPTDVLSFGQDAESSQTSGPRVLGDIVISLETVERHCAGASDLRLAMRKEVCLLFCHGLLHLLGADHATAQAREAMNAKQAQYLGVTKEAAWRILPKAAGNRHDKGRAV